jgi:hypothetical protein
MGALGGLMARKITQRSTHDPCGNASPPFASSFRDFHLEVGFDCSPTSRKK